MKKLIIIILLFAITKVDAQTTTTLPAGYSPWTMQLYKNSADSIVGGKTGLKFIKIADYASVKRLLDSSLTKANRDFSNVANGAIPIFKLASTASTSTPGYLTAYDWNVFNSKGSGTVTGITPGYGLTPNAAITSSGTFAADTTVLVTKATAQSISGRKTFVLNSLGTSVSDAIGLFNYTPATNVLHQNSPSFTWSSNGWNATAGTSQKLGFSTFLKPIPWGSDIRAEWIMTSSINGSNTTDSIHFRAGSGHMSVTGYNPGYYIQRTDQIMNGDNLGFVAWKGKNSSGDYGNGAAAIFVNATQNFATGATGVYMDLQVAPNGSITRATRLRVLPTGINVYGNAESIGGIVKATGATLTTIGSGTAGTDSVLVKNTSNIVRKISPTYYLTSASASSTYLPLAGGTLTGELFSPAVTITGAGTFAQGVVRKSTTDGFQTRIISGSTNDYALYGANGTTVIARVPTGTNELVAQALTIEGAGTFGAGVMRKSNADGFQVAAITGSVNDYAILTPTGSSNILSVPTGTSNAVFAGNVTSNSDRRFKKNIRLMKNASRSLRKIKPSDFDWIKDGKADKGFIAQNIEKYYPEFVLTDANGFKSVDYGRMTVPLLKGWQEHDSRISALENELKEIKRLLKK